MPIDHGTQGRQPTFYNLILPGTVSDRKKDASGLHVRVTHPDKSGVVSAWLPVLQRGTVGTQDFFLPRVGEQVWVAYDPTGVEKGLVLGSTYTTNLPPPSASDPDSRYVLFDDGSFFQFDPDAKKLTANTKGEWDITAVGPIKIVTTGGDLDVTVQGNLNATVSGTATIQSGGTATVQAPTIDLTGNVVISGTLIVGGNTTVNGGTTIVQNLQINGTETGGGPT